MEKNLLKEMIRQNLDVDDIRVIYNDYKKANGKQEANVLHDVARKSFVCGEKKDKFWTTLAEAPLDFIATQYLEKGSLQGDEGRNISPMSKKLDFIVLGLNPYDPLVAISKRDFKKEAQELLQAEGQQR